MSIYDSLNAMQREAVEHTEGPLLILAGAGSGKTRVLTHRIAYLIEEQGVNPWNILAITFTNKAAAEMRTRVDELVGFGSESIWVSTFHSACVRILRRHIDLLGYDHNFTIYDTDDQKVLMKDICKHLQIDTKMYKERTLLRAISAAKDEMTDPQEFRLNADGDYGQEKVAQVYGEYERQMKANNALDFDDLLMKTVELFQASPEVLASYQERFKYIMVDEYQDTNTVQFQFVSMLASKYGNLCVVGDDDQSIYKFRGANIKNILNFEHKFQDTKVIKLEQNYRSTSNILDAANAVIRHNVGRKSKTLWTDNGEGDKLDFRQFDDGYGEARYVVEEIRKGVNEGESYHDHAILYRTNAQSRLLEEALVAANIPYKLVGGVNFYARREIKDILAYLKTLDNGKDDLAARRIINVPKRGIGLTTINRIQASAMERGLGFYETLQGADLIPGLGGRAVTKVSAFASLMEHLSQESKTLKLPDLLDYILELTGYEEELKEEGTEEAEARMENIEELKSKMTAYQESCEDEPPTLSGFLEEVALVADVDSLDDASDYVVLMTLHSAKGLEFPHVFLTGMEDGLFPSYLSITADDPLEIEEERRLCYVGITRAKQQLTMTCARMRMVRGEMQYNRVSRFLGEVPKELLSTGEMFIKPKESREQKERTGSSTYGHARYNFQAKAYDMPKKTQQFTVKDQDGPGYDVGDRVRHAKFGEGTVQAVTQGGRDYEVTVDFDKAGVKKMFAMFAKLEKEK